MTKQPHIKVSVVTTVFNGIEFLAETVESVLQQTFEDFEYIIVDDGSTDETLKYLEGLKDTRIKIISLPHSGRGVALNTGLKNANSELIAILDADDIASKDRLFVQYNFMIEHPEISVLSSKCTVNKSKIFENINPESYRSNELNLVEFIKHNPVCHSSSIIRLSALRDVGNYDVSRTVLFDYDLWIKLVIRKHVFVKIHLPLVFKRIHSNQSFERKNRLHYLIEATKLKYKVKQYSNKDFREYSYIFFSFFYALIPISIRKKLIGRL